MKRKLDLLGSILGVFGAAISLLAGLTRLVGRGNPSFMTVAPRHILLAGISIMVFACWLKLTSK